MRSKSVNALLLCVAFFALLSLPALLWLTGQEPRPFDLLENRKLASMPDYGKTNWKQWAKATETWLADAIPLRSQYVAAYMRLWEWHLYTPVRFALRGSGDQLFNLGILRQHSGLAQMTPRHLYKLRAIFAGRNAYFTQRNIPYLLVIPPDKETMLVSHLPLWLREAHAASFMPSLEKLLTDAQVPMIALHNVLKNSNLPPEEMYSAKFDVWHWNLKALLLADQALRGWLHESVSPSFPVKRDMEPNVFMTDIPAGPFGMDRMPKSEDKLPASMRARSDALPIVVAQPKPAPKDVLITTGLKNFRLAVSCDSYFHEGPRKAWPILPNTGRAVLPLTQDVQESLWFHSSNFTFATMEKMTDQFKPDAFIDQRGERTFYSLLQENTNIEMTLMGEKSLDNIKLALTPNAFSAREVRNGQVIHEKDSVRLKADNNDLNFMLPGITITAEGYAVVTGLLRAPEKTRAELFYRRAGGAWQGVGQQVNKGETLLYFQILAEPDTTLELRLDPGMVKGEYALLPMPFLDDISPKARGTQP